MNHQRSVHAFGFDQPRADEIKLALEGAFAVDFFDSPGDLTDGYFTSREAGGPEAVLLDLGSSNVEAWLQVLELPFGRMRVSCPIVAAIDESALATFRLEAVPFVSDFVAFPPRPAEARRRLECAIRAPVTGLRIGLEKLRAFGPGLTFTECRILAEFLSAPRQRVRREELTRAIWVGLQVNPKTLDVHIFNLRKKIAEAGYRIDFSRKDGSWSLVAAKELADGSTDEERMVENGR